MPRFVKVIIGEFTAGRVFIGSYEYVVKVASGTPCSGASEEDYGYIKCRKRRVVAIEVLNLVSMYRSGSLDLWGLKTHQGATNFCTSRTQYIWLYSSSWIEHVSVDSSVYPSSRIVDS